MFSTSIISVTIETHDGFVHSHSITAPTFKEQLIKALNYKPMFQPMIQVVHDGWGYIHGEGWVDAGWGTKLPYVYEVIKFDRQGHIIKKTDYVGIPKEERPILYDFI